MGKFMNLLDETTEFMEENGHSFEDIFHIGNHKYECSVEDFYRLANIEYDEGYGSQEIACDLRIYFKNGDIMYRREYDGSETWMIIRYPNSKCIPIQSLREEGWYSIDVQGPSLVDLNPKQSTACRQQILDMLEEVLEDTMKVFDFGNQKHPDSGDTPNFLTPEGNKCSSEVRGNSCLHHAASVRCGEQEDKESGLHPALHLIASAAIVYIRQKRNIIHSDDQE